MWEVSPLGALALHCPLAIFYATPPSLGESQLGSYIDSGQISSMSIRVPLLGFNVLVAPLKKVGGPKKNQNSDASLRTNVSEPLGEYMPAAS